jgi:hypothetical protein
MRSGAVIAWLGCCLAGTGVAPRPGPPPAGRPFADVPRDHWAYDAVEELRQRGILRGYPSAPAAARRPAVPSKPPAPSSRPAPRSR